MRPSLRLLSVTAVSLSVAALVAFGAAGQGDSTTKGQRSPYDTVLFMTGGTGHRPDSKYDSTRSVTVAMGAVQSVVVTVYTRDGKAFTRHFAGGQIDALFFTMPAVEKFVVPYYARQFGDTAGTRVRVNVLRAFETAPHQ